MVRSILSARLPWIGLAVLLLGEALIGCTSTPIGSETSAVKLESPALPSDTAKSQREGGKEEVSEGTPGGEEPSPTVASATGIESKKIEEQAEAPEKVQGKALPTKPKGPTLHLYGLFDGFTFSTPKPILRWKVDPAGTPVRVELSREIEFTPESILWSSNSQEDHVQLPDLEEGRAFYLRIGVSQNEAFLKETVLTFTVSYKPFSVPLLPVLKPGNTVTFTMGYNGGLEREKPEHKVTLTRPYALGTYEVTNEEFATVMNRLLRGGVLRWEGKNLVALLGIVLAGGEELSFGTQFGFTLKDGLLVPLPGKEKHPVVGVSWYGAWVFCYYLSLMEGLEPALHFDPSDPLGTVTYVPDAEGYRLPTEAEWEYAARDEKGILYPGGVLVPNGVNFYRSGDPFEGYLTLTEGGGPTTPVGYFDGSLRGRFRTVSNAGPFGHFDLLGNVWEWCTDWFDPEFYRQSPEKDPEGPETGSQRVVRGGAWNTQRQDLRLTLRGFFPPEGTSYSIGFRLARTLKDRKN